MNRDQLSGLFWLGIAIFLCLESFGLNIGTLGQPGPGFLVLFSGVILGIFAVIVIVKGTLVGEGIEKIKLLWQGMRVRKVILILVCLLVYALVLDKAGYLMTTFVLMTILFGVMGRPKLWVQILGGLVTTLVTYIVFHIFLDVVLPRGILGI